MVRRAEAVEHEGDMLLLDETAGLLDRLRRAVAVVEADEIDLAAVDAALIVDHLEIGGLRPADHAVGGGRSAVGDGLAELDLGVRDAGRILARAACEPLAAYAAAAAAADSNRTRRVIMLFLPMILLLDVLGCSNVNST